jgi:hypothetical protein
MSNEYNYSVDQCDIALENRDALRSFREKRRKWLSWIDTDEHHAISQVLSLMVWTDVSFRMLSYMDDLEVELLGYSKGMGFKPSL